MIGAKHMDPILGVDIHIILIPSPAGPIPTPLPNPFVGMVLDPMDYAPFIGATVKINGMPRAQAGTGGVALPPHLPLGGPFGPPPPGNEAEIFMGSATVASDGDAQSLLGMMVLTCQSIGMPAPPRAKGAPAKSLVLPTSVVLAVPMGPPVLVGGPPTISLMALGMRAGMALLGKLGKMLRKAQRGAGKFGKAMRAITKKARKAGDKLADALKLGAKGRNRINKAICTVTGHPVDVATGKVFTDKVDLELPGAIPFRWERTWFSTSTYDGPLGHGWHHIYDAGLYVTDDVVLYRAPDGRLISFPPLKEGEEYFDRTERLTLIRNEGKRDGEYAIRTIDRLTYRFLELRKHHRRYPPDAVAGPLREHVLTGIHNTVGQSIACRYDQGGNLIEIVDTAGRSIQLSYDRNDRITTLTAPHPDEEGQRFIVMQYAYDSSGNLVQAVDALGHPFTYGYDRHLLVKETDRNGLSFYFEWDRKDEHAKCLRTWGDGGIYDHKLVYDTDANLTVVENSLGYKTQYFHDGGLVTKVIDARGGVTETEHNEHAQPLKETNPVGSVLAWAYDERGNIAEISYPDGAKLTFDNDGTDSPRMATDALGGTWKWSYDAQGRLVERENPMGGKTRFSYQGTRLSALIDALGNVIGFSYDARGLLGAVHAPDGGSDAWQYDRLGRVTHATDPNGNVQRRHRDLLGRIVRIDEPDGNVREHSFDGEGNLVRIKDANRDVRLTYQGVGRVATRAEAGTTVRFEYDTEERLIGITNEHGHVYRFELGPTGDVEIESNFDGAQRVLEHDAAGQVIRAKRANGIETTYGYDKGGRVTKIAHMRKQRAADDGDPSSVVLVEEPLGYERFVYRKDGELLQAENDVCKLVLEHDALGRIVKENQGKHWVQSERNLLGQRVRMYSSLGADLAIERNAVGDVEHVKSSAGFEARMRRDLLGLELERELPGGVTSRWRRDKLGRPLQHEITAGPTLLRARSYHWEKGDRLRTVIDAMQGPVHYTHDAFGNLAAATYADGASELRMPDAVGNLFKTEARRDRKYGRAGQLLESTDARGRITRYAYDSEGNLIEKHEGSGRLWKYRWNAAGMLSEVERPDATVVRFEYDALGRRVAKHFRGLTTRWVWDGNAPLHEWVEGKLEQERQAQAVPMWMADADIKRREAELSEHLTRGPPQAGSKEQPITWLFEPESFKPLAKLSGSGPQSIVTDHLGTPVAMLDASGQKVWSADISVYGELRSLEGGRFACPFRWPGQYEDAETGLYYNRFRYYDPESGQYTSQDPIRTVGGLRLQSYVHDPLAFSDPLGLAACHASGARGVAQAEKDLLANGFKKVDREVTILTPNGSRIRSDLLYEKNGKYYVVEVKNGSGGLTPNQTSSGMFDMGSPSNSSKAGGGTIDPSKGKSGTFEVATDNRPNTGPRGTTEPATYMTLIYDV